MAYLALNPALLIFVRRASLCALDRFVANGTAGSCDWIRMTAAKCHARSAYLGLTRPCKCRGVEHVCLPDFLVRLTDDMTVVLCCSSGESPGPVMAFEESHGIVAWAVFFARHVDRDEVGVVHFGRRLRG